MSLDFGYKCVNLSSFSVFGCEWFCQEGSENSTLTKSSTKCSNFRKMKKNLSLSKAESFSDLSRVRKVIETQPLDKNFFWRMKGKGSFGDFEIKKT